MAGVNGEVHADRLAGVRKLLERLPVQVDKYLSEAPQRYAAGSRAAEEGEMVEEEAINTVVDVARISILSAGDHMAALDRALSAPTLTFSPWTITRTILEATARGSWVLDPQIDGHERIARSMALRFADVREQIKVAKSYQKQERAMVKSLDLSAIEKEGRNRQNEIVRQAQTRGISVRKKNGKVTKIGSVTVEPNLSITNIVQIALDAQNEYIILSGAEHQKLTFLRSLSMAEIQEGSGVFGTGLGVDQFFYMVISSLRWYGITTWRHFKYCGLDIVMLEKLLSETAEQVRIRGKFWEQ